MNQLISDLASELRSFYDSGGIFMSGVKFFNLIILL